MYEAYGYYHTPTKTLTPSEECFLNAFLDALYKINPQLHKNLSCMKGWEYSLGYWDGVYILMPGI